MVTSCVNFNLGLKTKLRGFIPTETTNAVQYFFFYLHDAIFFLSVLEQVESFLCPRDNCQGQREAVHLGFLMEILLILTELRLLSFWVAFYITGHGLCN